jgi:hypothetical protein
MRTWTLAVVVLSSFIAARVSRADTLQVGPNQAYATPCAAIAAANPKDQIEIAPGTYTDSCSITLAGLTLRGQGGQPKIDLSGTDHPAQYKAIYVIAADDVTVEGLELTGAHISDANGANAAALRVEAQGLTVRGCNIHDNQNGILGGSAGTLTIEHTEFHDNGLGDGCNQGGCTHNVYVGNIDTLYFRFNWSHRIATDTADKGHLLKSRARANYVLYNRLTGEDGFDSYEIDLPNGGLAVVVGNQVEKGSHAGNSTLLSWGEEGATNPDKRVFLVNNTFVNDYGSGKFLGVSGATLSAHNNIFAGAGSLGSPGTLSADNWIGSDPLFIDRVHFDHHLKVGSPAIGLGVEPGMADQFSLVAASEYAHPLGERARASAHDLGAFEYGTSSNGTAQDAGVAGAQDAARPAPAGGMGAAGMQSAAGQAGVAGRAGSPGVAGAGGSSGAAALAGTSAVAAGSGGAQPDHAADGCNCAMPGVPRPGAGSGLGWLSAWLLVRRLRRRRENAR